MARVLVVDDDAMILELVRRALTSAGHDVAIVDDGDTALEHLGNEPFDLVVTDIVMPGREGIELILQIRRRWPDLPVIAMSGGQLIGRESLLDMAHYLGAISTLAKPFRSHQLVELVKISLA